MAETRVNFSFFCCHLRPVLWAHGGGAVSYLRGSTASGLRNELVGPGGRLSNLIADRERQQLDSGRLGFIVVTRSCNKGSCRNLKKLLSDSDFTYSLPYSSWRESFYILVPAAVAWRK